MNTNAATKRNLTGALTSPSAFTLEPLEFAIGDGQRIRYSRSGQGRPLVLMHTLRTQIEYFRYVIPHLEKNFTVYAIDFPGHGESSIDTSAAYDEPYLRKAVVAFVKGLDLRDVVLAGESIGGALALTVSTELPDRVTAVVASNPYDYETRYGDGVRRGNFLANFVLLNFSVPYFGAVFAALENVFILAGIMRGGVTNSTNMPFSLVRIFDRTGRRPGYRYVERKMFSGWRSWAGARLLYPHVKAPVLLLQAQNDWSRPDERKRTADALPTATVVPVEGAGHFAFLERAKVMTDRISGMFAAKTE